MKEIVLIPAYQPDEQLIGVVEKLSEYGVGILVVDDGSGTEYLDVFDKIREKADVFHIPCNGGKGTALKNGMAVIQTKYPECEYFVTADADGQHKCEDIMRVFDELKRGAEFVLTVRNFDKSMPKRSRFGNDLSRYIYTVLNSHYLKDNQSGLRGFKASHIEWLLRVDGNKYDYEINMLYYADKQSVQITTIPIEAIYINDNSSSHFSPVKDTFRIYARLFYSARASFISFLMVETTLLVLSIIFNYKFLHITIPTAGAAATLLKLTLNFFWVFRKFKYRDLFRTIIYAVFRYLVYTMGTYAIGLAIPFLPMFISFNLVVLVSLVAEYYIHKFSYIAKYNDINKEK